MDSLIEKMDTIRKVIAEYAKPPVGGQAYLTQNSEGTLFSVVDVYTSQGEHYADAGLIVRIEGPRIIIERDMNNKPLVDALLQAGISRKQIILAYAGESIEELA